MLSLARMKNSEGYTQRVRISLTHKWIESTVYDIGKRDSPRENVIYRHTRSSNGSYVSNYWLATVYLHRQTIVPPSFHFLYWTQNTRTFKVGIDSTISNLET